MALSVLASHGSFQKPAIMRPVQIKTSQPISLKPTFRKMSRLPLQEYLSKALRNTSRRMLEAFVDSVFRFVDQPLLPSQMNFAPVEEIGKAIEVFCTEGEVPADFPHGVFIRNGSNPLFGGQKSTESIFGRSSRTWVEGEGMLHAVYFMKNSYEHWSTTYKNKYVESETFKIEKNRGKPSFLPALEGDSWAIIAAYLLNTLRYGMVEKHFSNTNVFEHGGKIYTIAENYVPQEVDLLNLEIKSDWNFKGEWDRPFTSHPKKAPNSGELVTMGLDAKRPYYALGIISADGKKLLHKVDLNIGRSILSHDIGVIERFNVIIDHPLVFDTNRLSKGGPLLKFDRESYTRIGVMPRYGDVSSIKWFVVTSCCIFHIFNSFEDANEVVVRGCRAITAMIPGPEWGEDKFEWFSRGFNFEKLIDTNLSIAHDGYLFSCPYEWRLNMETGAVNEARLIQGSFSMDFPFINEAFTGLRNKYGYAQVINSKASSQSGMTKYGGLAKLYFDEPCNKPSEELANNKGLIKVEYHNFGENIFCTRSVFVPKDDGIDEGIGWIVTFAHNEETNVSQVYIIDAEKFESEPVSKITLPRRVPYGFHGAFVPFVKSIA